MLFALALVASGLSSSAVGTLSGQVVMQGFIRRQIPIAVRRLVTMVPAFIVIAIGLNPTRTLVISQVVLSFGIPFALVPLVWFTARRDVMGPLVNRRVTTVVASVVAAAIVGLNFVLLGPDRRALTARARAAPYGGGTPVRPDELPVVGVLELAGPVVELELLEGGERTVALLDQLQPPPSASVGASSLSSSVCGSRRNGSATSSTAATAITAPRTTASGAHARAGASRVTRRRCSRASGHSVTSEPNTNRRPASQIRLTSGFTSTLKKTAFECGSKSAITYRSSPRSQSVLIPTARSVSSNPV